MTTLSFDIDKKASAYIDPKLCINCGKCRRACPTNSIEEMQRLICRLCPDCVDACSDIKFHLESHDYAKQVACSIGCPLGIVPEGYVNLISQGEIQGAYDLITELNPLASICGSICSHPCEDACKRGTLIDKPIAIRALKRYVMENAEKKPIVFKQKYDNKIAIVGAGPAGITAAYDLAKKGYKVTIFEASASLGGAMKWGIPDFRLDKDMLKAELESIIAAGIHVEFNAMVGVNPTIDDLINENYSAVLLAVGGTKGFKLPIKNNTAEMVYDAATFMKKVNSLTPVKIGKKAVIIGGGSVALDTARSLIRLGIEKVTCVCLEDKNTIPAPASEVAEALEEGVEIITGASPQEINATWIHVSGVTFKKVSKMGVDETGKFIVETIDGSDFELDCDTVIFATGQKVDVDTMTRKSNLALLPNGKIAIDENMKTNIPNVFACGDAVPGSKCSVVYAMTSGRKAALAIDNMIWDRELDLNVEHELHKAPIDEMLYPVRFERLYPQRVKRIKDFEDFEEVEISFTKKQAMLEARRCMKCGYEKVNSDTCIGCGTCAAYCPQNAITLVNPSQKEGK